MFRIRAALTALVLGGCLVALLTGCTAASAEAPLVAVAFPGDADDAWGRGASVLEEELESDGFRVDVRHAGDDVPTQARQVDELLELRPMVLVVAPVDPSALVNRLERADQLAVPVIAYDRLPTDADAVDYYATFDRELAGRQQAEALLAGLDARAEADAEGQPVGPDADTEPDPGPAVVELIGGSGDDPAAAARFRGALSVLAPAIEAGTLVVPSGRTTFDTAAILRADPEIAADRVSELELDGFELDGVLCPDDRMSRAVVERLELFGNGQVVTGGGAQLDSLRSILDGDQYSTVLEDPRTLARTVAGMVQRLARGQDLLTTTVTDNGAAEVPTRLVPTVAVDASNLERRILDSGYRTRQQLER